MKIAVFGDVHGNFYGLQSVLEDIQYEKPDKIFCTGDLLTPYPGAAKVWKTVFGLKIPIVKGNGEERIISYFSKSQESPMKTAVQFKPLRIVAKELDQSIISELERLPLTRTIQGPDDTKILICHGTPFNNEEFLIDPDGLPLTRSIEDLSVDIVVAGHCHRPYQIEVGNTLLVTAGSAGLAFCGKPLVNYLILEYEKKNWNLHHKVVRYNSELLIKDLQDANYLKDGGPLSWLIFDEISSHQDRVYPFLTKHCPKPYPETEQEWSNACIDYLQSIRRWKHLKKHFF